jgi:hypothetical protein
MPNIQVTMEENEKYRRFVSDVAQEMGAFDLRGEDIVWHYTNGSGFLGILQSSTIYASQVSCLNDTTETNHAADLYKKAVAEVMREHATDLHAVEFLERVLEFVKEEPDSSHTRYKQVFCYVLQR